MSGTAGAQDWGDCRHVLAIRLDGLGDVLMTTPALRALRADGARRITLLTSPAGAALRPFVPEADAVLEHEAAWMKNDAVGNHADLALIGRLRALRPDAAVIFTVCTQSALPAAVLCHLAGVPRILAHSRENPYRLLTHWVRDEQALDGMRHEVRRQLDLVAAVGATTGDQRLSFRLRAQDRAGLDEILRRSGVTEPGGWIAVHAGATAPSRRYPARQLVQALVALRTEGRRILMLGGSEHEDLAAALAGARRRLPGIVDLSGRLSLGELGAALERAGVLVCNNSGPAHIAAALGTPVVDLYALTNPQHTPWGTASRVLSHDVPCRFCLRSVCPQGHHACLAGVAPERVAEAARELLREAPPSGIAASPEELQACIR